MNHDISMNVRGDSFVCGVCLRGSHVVLTLFFGLVRGHQIPDVQLCLDVLGDSLSFSKLRPACVEWKVKAESVSYDWFVSSWDWFLCLGAFLRCLLDVSKTFMHQMHMSDFFDLWTRMAHFELYKIFSAVFRLLFDNRHSQILLSASRLRQA